VVAGVAGGRAGHRRRGAVAGRRRRRQGPLRRPAAGGHPRRARELVVLLPPDHIDPPEHRAYPRADVPLQAMTAGARGMVGRPRAGRTIVAVLVGAACVMGAAAPARALEPVRLALADGLRHVEIGVADTVTVFDPAAGRALF